MPFDFSLVEAPFRMQPGLRRLAAGQRQLTPSRPAGRHLREKMAVLGRYAEQALVGLPGFDPSPALRALAAEATRGSFDDDGGDGGAACLESHAAPTSAFTFATLDDCAAPRLGWSIGGGEVVEIGGCGGGGGNDPAIGSLLHALPCSQRAAGLASLAFEEDLAVVDGATGTIPWLAVCLPSRWAPETKVGRAFAEVHAPVADGARIVAASGHLVGLVTAAERWERFVWTISADPRLHQHPDRSDASWPDADDANTLAARASLRSERQTFVPVPGVRQALFTIRVESRPLRAAIAEAGEPAEAAARLHAALASMTLPVLRYRGLESARDRLLRWLEDAAASEPTSAAAPPP